MKNIIHLNYLNTGAADGSIEKPYAKLSEALAAMDGVLGGYMLNVYPGVYIETDALETPAQSLMILGNGATLVCDGGLTVKGALIKFEVTITGTVTIDGGSVKEIASDTDAQRLSNKTLVDPIEEITIGTHDYAASAASWVLSAAELGKRHHKPTNASGAVNAVIPVTPIREFDFLNATGQTLTVKTPSGTGVAIANGKNAKVRSDATNVIRLTPDA